MVRKLKMFSRAGYEVKRGEGDWYPRIDNGRVSILFREIWLFKVPMPVSPLWFTFHTLRPLIHTSIFPRRRNKYWIENIFRGLTNLYIFSDKIFTRAIFFMSESKIIIVTNQIGKTLISEKVLGTSICRKFIVKYPEVTWNRYNKNKY